MDPITLLQQLIQVNSVNGNERAVVQIIQSYLADAGIDAHFVETAPGRDNLIAEIGSGHPLLAWTGHADVVSAEPVASWAQPPFAGLIQADTIYGRGSVDMKGGLAAMTVALATLHQNHFAGHIRFIVTVGEEYGAPGSRQLTQAGVVDDIDALVVGEPTDHHIEYAHAGSFNYKVHSQGLAGHSSRPELAKNAIEPLADFIVRERHLFDDAPTDPVIGALIHSVTVINGGAQVNTIPDTASLAGNVRPTPSFTNQMVTERLQSLVDSLNKETDSELTFELTHSFFPVYTEPTDHLVQIAQLVAEKAFDQRIPLTISHGATDASEFTKSDNHFPTIILGPGDNHLSHQINEHLPLADYRAAITTYIDLAQAYFAH
ncbi:ArgE/DapE family deacylase [Lacticaseibacillus saniviri]